MIHGFDVRINAMKTLGLRASPGSECSTRDLSSKTWLDFERLFESHPAPGAYPCWCMHDHLYGPVRDHNSCSRALKVERNHQEKKILVERGSSHGILVYAQGEPVGWCQYGLRQELPRIDRNANYRKLPPASDGKPLWRITCFVVHRNYRRRGVASTALKAAIAAIRSRGGGFVEAYPIRHWSAYSKYRGTISMFEKEGFKVIAPLGESNVLMRRII
jgi:ribosomal protein S18 acetylase RimI-like enzyme